MGYIEIKKSKNNRLICTYVNEGEKIFIKKNKIIKMLILLKLNGLTAEKTNVNGMKVIRYYSVKQSIIDKIIGKKEKNKNKKLILKKKIKPAIALVGSALTLVVMFNSCSKNSSKHEKTDVSTETIAVKEEPVTEEEMIEQIIEEEVIEPIEIDDNFDFVYEDRSQIDEAVYVRETYTDIITEQANIYGLPANLMIAMATEESRGICTAWSDAGAFSLFQIKVKGNWNWVGKQLTAYNFLLGEYETVTVCLNEAGNLDINMLEDPSYSAKIGCMIMSSNLERCDYDIICALQAYNAGNKPINLWKKYGEDWIYYREEELGYSEYVEKVLSFIEPYDNILFYMDSDLNSHTISVTNVSKKLRKRVLTRM